MATVRIGLPAAEESVRRLSAGDEVLLSGIVYTGRDRFHKHLAEGNASPVDLRGGAIYHCGPVVLRAGQGWRIVAAGPTTSARENPYMAGIIRREGVRIVIGKGGMGEETVAACRECGCVYLQAVGGAAASLAKCVRKVAGVRFLEEFGATEACWALEVADFPAMVAIDASGRSLFAEVRAASKTVLDGIVFGTIARRFRANAI